MRRWFLGLLFALALPADALTYVDLLDQLHDLDRLTRPQTGITAHQASSYERRDRESWGVNGDAGHYERVEPDGEAVLFEADGPGCLWRIWSANPQGRLRFYFDGAAAPSWELPFEALFEPGRVPFVKPLVYQRDTQRSAHDCYVPIPFARHVKVTAEARHPQYYHFDWLHYPAGTTVPTFRLPLTDAETAAVYRAAAAWSLPGMDPKPRLPGQRTARQTVTLQPGRSVALADLTGPGQFRAWRVRLDAAQRYAWRKVVLQGVFDESDWPQVWSPLGALFGFDWQTADYGGFPVGCLDGEAYLFFPMPFARRAQLNLTSYLQVPAEVTFVYDWAPTPEPAGDTCTFFARWRQEVDSTTFDYPFLETAGEGHVVGIGLQLNHPIPGWWGEGDEKIWIDDDTFPSWIGTGSEDYFGDAWGIRYLPEPMFGCSLNEATKTCAYRWHVTDLVPFTKRIRFTIENYGVYRNFQHEHEYNSVAYWYQRESRPNFAANAGVTYEGGATAFQPIAEYPYGGDIFPAIGAAQTICEGLDIPFAIEAETLLPAGRIITDLGRDKPFSRERAVALGAVREGQVLATVTLPGTPGEVYYPRLYTAAGDGLAELSLRVGEQTLTVARRSSEGELTLGGLELPAGGHAELVATKPGRAIFDAVALRPATRREGVIEAESLTVLGGHAEVALDRGGASASAGRLLSWDGAAPLRLQIEARPTLPYELSARLVLAPDAPIVQAFVDGQPVGAAHDLYQAGDEALSMPLPCGVWTKDRQAVELRRVGRNPKSSGNRVALDCFEWTAVLVNPERSTPGVSAWVAQTAGCETRIQNLGDRFLYGHQLWVQPSRANATVDLAVLVPEAGRYELAVRLTTSRDYAIVAFSLDGQAIGPRIDTFTPPVLLREEDSLGVHQLTAGQHLLQLKAVDKNPASTGYLMGLDYLVVKRAGG